MSKYINTIEYHLQTKLDESGVTKLMASLREVEKQMDKAFTGGSKELNKTAESARKVQKALAHAFEADLGILNVKKFNDALRNSGTNIKDLHRDFQRAGKAGAKAFDEVTYQSLSLNKGVKQTSLALEKMANTMWNTVRWGITAGIFQGITTEIRKSFDYAKDLDTSLNSIRIVTGKSAAEMKDFSMYANKAAQSLGAATKAYSDAALIFYQQGLGDVESKEMARLTVTTSNVTGQDTAVVSEQLTSIRNGYKLTTDEMERYLDTTALIAAETAADLEEMATAMSKVSSAANMMGVEYDQLNAILATVVSVTRQAPENVGTAFKTIFARLGDLKAAGVAVDESGFEVKLGQISTQLNQMGVSILDTNGNMRDMGDIVAEVGTKWDGWTQAQKLAAAQAMAGKRQYNNLVALFENWDMYSEQMLNAADAEGTLAQQNAIYLESVEAHLQKIQTAKERVYNAFFDIDAIKGAADVAAGLVQTIAQLMESIGGGIPVIQGLGSALMYIFSNQIASGINKALISMKSMKQIADSTKQVVENVRNMYAGSVDFSTTEGGTFTNSAAGNMVEFAEKAAPYTNIMTGEQTQAYQSYLTQIKEVSQVYDDLKFKQEGLKQESAELTVRTDALTFETAHYENELRDLLKTQEQALVGADKTKERGIKNSAVYKEQELRIKELSDAIAENNRENKRIETQQGRVNRELKKTNIEITDQQTKIDQVRQAWQGFIKTLDTQALAQGFTKMASGAGQLVFALSSLSNLGDIWSNENLSGGEKVLQTITALSFGIVSLTTGLKSLKEGYASVSGALTKFILNQDMATIATAKETIASIANTGVTKKSTKEDIKAIFTNYTLSESIEEGTEELVKNSIAKLLNEETTQKLTRAQAKETLEKLIETGAIKLNTEAQIENAAATKAAAAAKAVLQAVSSPVGLAIVVITAAVVAATAAMAAYEKRLIETNKATIESAKAFREDHKAILDQIDAYEKLNETHKAGEANSEQMKEGAAALAESLDNQNLRVYAAQRNWSAYANELAASKKQILDTTLEMDKAAAAAAEQNAQIEKSGGVWGTFFEIIVKSSPVLSAIVAIIDIFVEAFKSADLFFAHANIVYQDTFGWIEDLKNDLYELIPLLKFLENFNPFKAGENISKALGLSFGLEDFETAAEAEAFYTTTKNQLTKEQIELEEELKQARITGRESEVRELEAEIRLKEAELDKLEQERNSLGTEHLEAVQANEQIVTDLLTNIEDSPQGLFEGSSIEEWNQYLNEQMKYMQENSEQFAADAAADWAGKRKWLQDQLIGMQSFNLEMNDAITSLQFEQKLKDELDFSDVQIDDLNNLFGSLASGQALMLEFGIDATSKEEILAFAEEMRNDPDFFGIVKAGQQAKVLYGLVSDALALGAEGKEIPLEIQSSLKDLSPTLEGLTAGSAAWLAELTKIAPEFLKIQTMADLAREKRELDERELPEGGISGGVSSDNWENFRSLEVKVYGDLGPIKEEIADLEARGYTVEAQFKADVEFYSALNELEEEALELKGHIEFSNNLRSTLKDVTTQFDKMQNMSAEIRDDFKLTTAQFEEALMYYPELANQVAAYTASGVELNQEATEAIIANDNLNTSNSIENMIIVLTLQRDLAAAKEEAYTNAANIALEAISSQTMGEIESAKTSGEISNALQTDKITKLEEQLKAHGIVTDEVVENEKLPANAAVEAARVGSEAMNNYANSMTTSIAKGVDISVRNLQGLGVFMIDPTSQSSVITQTYQESAAYTKPTYQAVGAAVQTADIPNEVKDPRDNEKILELENDYEKEMYAMYLSLTKMAQQAGAEKRALAAAIAVAKARQAEVGSGSTGSADKGGKDSTISDKTLEKLVEIFDKYYDINQEIKKLENSLARVVAVQGSLTGQALIDNLNQQLVIMEAQNEAIEKRLQLEKDERDQLKSELASKGITFDETGTITNYKDKFEELKAAVDEKAEAHEAAKTEAAKEALEKEYDAAKLAFDEFADLVERYDELNIDIIFNTEMEILEKQLEMIELNVQKMDIELEVTLDTNEAIRKWNEFEAVVLNGLDLEDPLTAITNTVKNLSSYWNGTDGSLDVLSRQIANLNEQIAIMEAGGESDQFGSGETGLSAATEKLKDLMDQFIEMSLEYDEMVKSIKENTLNWIDATADGFSEINSQFEYVSSELEHHANVIKLIYGEEAYEQMEGYYEAQRANNSASIRALKSQVDSLTALRDALGQPGDENFDQELYDRYTSQIQNFQGELNSAIEESLQLLADEYSNSVSLILSNFAKDLSGGLGLPEIEKEWKRINEEADLYLDKTSATFKLNKLQSQYMDAINKADSSQVKQHLNDLMNEELKLLREKDELTQGDLERATKRFDIELKKIALEEAQRNKSTMKLQRDAQGNYSYVYTADEGAISKAAEELEAAQEEFYESSRNSLKENKDQFLSLFSEYQSELAEARTPEEIEKVNESFRKRFEAILSENTSITDALKKFYADEYGEGTAEYEAAVGGLDDTVQSMIDSLIGAGGFGAASEELKALLLEAFGDYQEGIEGIEEDSGRDFDSINASMEEAITYTQELVDKNEELINKMWEEADAINAATAAWREYDAATAGIRAGGNAAADTASDTTASPPGGFDGVTDTGDATVPDLPSYTDTGRDKVPTLPGDPATPTLPGDPAGDASEGVKAAEALAKDWIGTPYKMGGDSKKGVDCSHFAWRVANATGVRHPYAYTGAIKPSASYPSGKGKYVSLGWSKPGEVRGSKYGHAVIQVNGVQYESSGSKGVHANGKFKPNYWIHPKGFDTGGYTGEWSGADGKLAFLHQKEIVLKEGDTANLLLAVSAVRDLVGKIKTNTIFSQQDALKQFAVMPNIGAPAAAAGTSQQIQINADFPSVKDAEEIKKAFNNLINSAAQYANRKK